MFEQIPVDFVVDALLEAMTKHALNPGLQVYHVASSVVNPFTFEIMTDAALKAFTKNPMIDKAGQPIIVQPWLIMQSMTAFNLSLWFTYQLPLEACYFTITI